MLDTSRIPDEDLLAYLETAIETPRGIAIYSADATLLRRRIYAFRRKLVNNGDSRFNGLSITVPKTHQNEIWLVPTDLLNKVRGISEEDPE